MDGDKIRDTLYTLSQHIVSDFKCFEEWCFTVYRLEQTVIWDCYKRVYLF